MSHIGDNQGVGPLHEGLIGEGREKRGGRRGDVQNHSENGISASADRYRVPEQ